VFAPCERRTGPRQKVRRFRKTTSGKKEKRYLGAGFRLLEANACHLGGVRGMHVGGDGAYVVKDKRLREMRRVVRLTPTVS
jgi:hypothetical protein